MIEKWIPTAERMPTEADADEYHCIIVWHALNGTMVTGWHQAQRNRFITHWMHCPAQPAQCDARAWLMNRFTTKE